MSSHVDALRRSLVNRLGLCNEDELRVLDELLGRLELGREQYGPLDLSRARDWERDEDEEWLDARVYRSIQRVLERRRRSQAIEAREESE